MSVPGRQSSLAGAFAGQADIAGETPEEKRRRLQMLKQQQQIPGIGGSSLAQGYAAALGGGAF
jgi:hypothetical protein